MTYRWLLADCGAIFSSERVNWRRAEVVPLAAGNIIRMCPSAVKRLIGYKHSAGKTSIVVSYRGENSKYEYIRRPELLEVVESLFPKQRYFCPLRSL